MAIEYFCPGSPTTHPVFVIAWSSTIEPPRGYCRVCKTLLQTRKPAPIPTPTVSPLPKHDLSTDETRFLEKRLERFKQAASSAPRTGQQNSAFRNACQHLVGREFSQEEVAKLVEALRQSPLTINFKLQDFRHYSALEILNGFQLAQPGGNVETSEKLHSRYRAEHEIFGNPFRGRWVLEGRHLRQDWHRQPKMFPGGDPYWGQDGFEMIFDSARLRPKYGALDYRQSNQGATPNAASYGLSYFLFDEKLKQRCTFTLGDSWDAATEDDDIFPCLFSLESFDLLLKRAVALNFDRKLLAHLCRRAHIDVPKIQGEGKKTYEASDTYVEAHIHGNVSFKTDLKTVYFSRSERGLLSSEHQQEVALTKEHYLSSLTSSSVRWETCD